MNKNTRRLLIRRRNGLSTKSLRRKMRAVLQQRQGVSVVAGMRLTPCVYCLKLFLLRHLTIEHLTPLSKGGTSKAHNLALACYPCNTARMALALPRTSRTLRFVRAARLKSLAQSVRA